MCCTVKESLFRRLSVTYLELFKDIVHQKIDLNKYIYIYPINLHDLKFYNSKKAK